MMSEPNDPTRSGSPLPAEGSGKVALSRNEIEGLCMKAARAAGMSWGLAEEAGFAAGWLAASGLNGATALLHHLRTYQGKSWEEISPVAGEGHWRTSGTVPMCPIALGAALCDHAGLPESFPDASGLVVGPVSQAVLVLPFLADIAGRLGMEITVKIQPGEFQTGSICLSPGGLIPVEAEELIGADAIVLTIVSGPARAGSTKGEDVVLAEIDRPTLAGLNALAMKITVPASEQSRAGAGAQASDND
ncbi:DUF3726 domain-containing protein [Salaquimonas pukyongi]|uniref:DUF3726 domain-containing protein n=1 Tax=Salaquimonas pukyongi TaxID=2712698 RepID=UPI0009FAB3F0|nr:DUF3726 domain-containing protein [Salaquimonas pukyongi]